MRKHEELEGYAPPLPTAARKNKYGANDTSPHERASGRAKDTLAADEMEGNPYRDSLCIGVARGTDVDANHVATHLSVQRCEELPAPHDGPAAARVREVLGHAVQEGLLPPVPLHL